MSELREFWFTQTSQDPEGHIQAKCDRETNSPTDILEGKLHAAVGIQLPDYPMVEIQLGASPRTGAWSRIPPILDLLS